MDILRHSRSFGQENLILWSLRYFQAPSWLVWVDLSCQSVPSSPGVSLAVSLRLPAIADRSPEASHRQSIM